MNSENRFTGPDINTVLNSILNDLLKKENLTSKTTTDFKEENSTSKTTTDLKEEPTNRFYKSQQSFNRLLDSHLLLLQIFREMNNSEYEQNWQTFNRLLDSHFQLLETN